MNTLLVTTDTKSNAKQLASFLKKVNSVLSITIASSEETTYNWINPSRPATDEEFEQMIAESEREIETGLGIPAEIAQKQTMDKIKKWKQKR